MAILQYLQMFKPLHKRPYDSWLSVSTGPTSADSTTRSEDGNSSEDSQFYVDLSPTNRYVPLEQLLYFCHLNIVT